MKWLLLQYCILALIVYTDSSCELKQEGPMTAMETGDDIGDVDMYTSVVGEPVNEENMDGNEKALAPAEEVEEVEAVPTPSTPASTAVSRSEYPIIVLSKHLKEVMDTRLLLRVF